MSGQPSGNPSGPRPTANGVGTAGMVSSQQRTDPQVGSSTSNGQSGSMSQSNLNSIVRQKISCLVLSALPLFKFIVYLSFVNSAPLKQEGSIYTGANRLKDKIVTISDQVEVPRLKTWRTHLLGLCCISAPRARRESYTSIRLLYHVLSIIQRRSFQSQACLDLKWQGHASLKNLLLEQPALCRVHRGATL